MSDLRDRIAAVLSDDSQDLNQSIRSDLRTRIAAVIVKHHTDCDNTVDGTWTQCQCDAGWRREDEWAVHVADKVIAELHPTRTCGVCGRTGTQKFRPHGDGWVCRSITACNRREGR